MKVGKWKLDSKIKSGVNFQLTSVKDDRVIYSFVVGSISEYIGCCQAQGTTLEKRMRAYRSNKEGKTNKRVLREIKEMLQSNTDVDIYAWIPPLQLTYQDLRCDTIVGFESALISRHDPRWNKAK